MMDYEAPLPEKYEFVDESRVRKYPYIFLRMLHYVAGATFMEFPIRCKKRTDGGKLTLASLCEVIGFKDPAVCKINSAHNRRLTWRSRVFQLAFNFFLYSIYILLALSSFAAIILSLVLLLILVPPMSASISQTVSSGFTTVIGLLIALISIFIR